MIHRRVDNTGGKLERSVNRVAADDEYNRCCAHGSVAEAAQKDLYEH